MTRRRVLALRSAVARRASPSGRVLAVLALAMGCTANEERSGGGAVSDGSASGGAGAASGGESGGGSAGAAGAGGAGASAGGGGAGSGGAGSGGAGAAAGSGGGAAAGGAGASCATCGSWGAPGSSASLQLPEVDELSGLAASRRSPGVYYAHNDSGDSARFFAFGEDGGSLGTFVLPGATARDWEDMDLGPCPAGSCVFLADFGDNARARTSYRIYRVTEPAVSAGSPGGTIDVAWDAFDYVYEDGSHNAEALLVHPTTGELYVMTKQAGASHVFRMEAPGAAGAQVTLTRIATLTLGAGALATGGSVHPCGDRLLLRTYGGLLEYVATGAFETAFAASPAAVVAAPEAQGEAVTYTADGLGYLTLSEGSSPALHLARCD
ncbi:MAG: hypothetical protein IT376_00065 [Polyangiaceae bacterium]|nr:hypothetical protein [Polyangiaceae bacterium]